MPSLQSQATFGGTTYALGTFDSGLGIYADRKALEAAGVGWPPSPEAAWSGKDFDDALARLARVDPEGKVLDVKLNYGIGEWLTYGFAPLVSSAGGSLVDPASGLASGHMDAAFVDRRVPLSWVGHWMYRDYAAALGDDLLVLPLPDLGAGSKTGQGSCAWAMTAPEPRREAADQLLDSCGDAKPERGCYAVLRPAMAAESVDRDIAANDGYR